MKYTVIDLMNGQIVGRFENMEQAAKKRDEKDDQYCAYIHDVRDENKRPIDRRGIKFQNPEY